MPDQQSDTNFMVSTSLWVVTTMAGIMLPVGLYEKSEALRYGNIGIFVTGIFGLLVFLAMRHLKKT